MQSKTIALFQTFVQNQNFQKIDLFRIRKLECLKIFDFTGKPQLGFMAKHITMTAGMTP